jgi:hypothetical protein
MTDDESARIGVCERVLRSRVIRGIVHIQAGFSLVRSWFMDVQVPQGTAIHLFDYLLYRRTKMEEPFEVWIKKRRLLFP